MFGFFDSENHLIGIQTAHHKSRVPPPRNRRKKQALTSFSPDKDGSDHSSLNPLGIWPVLIFEEAFVPNVRWVSYPKNAAWRLGIHFDPLQVFVSQLSTFKQCLANCRWNAETPTIQQNRTLKKWRKNTFRKWAKGNVAMSLYTFRHFMFTCYPLSFNTAIFQLVVHVQCILRTPAGRDRFCRNVHLQMCHEMDWHGRKFDHSFVAISSGPTWLAILHLHLQL